MTGYEFELLMKAEGFSQASLCKRWGINRHTVSRICNLDEVDRRDVDALMGAIFQVNADKLKASIVSIEQDARKAADTLTAMY